MSPQLRIAKDRNAAFTLRISTLVGVRNVNAA